jgi:hypothetical protein
MYVVQTKPMQYSMFAPGKDEKVIVDTTNLKLYEFSTFENFNYIYVSTHFHFWHLEYIKLLMNL